MAGEEESLELGIDVSLDQDKDENQEEIIYSQNSDVDVVDLESDSPPSSSSASNSDGDGGNMSGPEHVYPFFITHKWDRQNFRKRTKSFRWDEHRQKLFHFYKDQFGFGSYKSSQLI